jgi:hypothetical protein
MSVGSARTNVHMGGDDGLVTNLSSGAWAQEELSQEDLKMSHRAQDVAPSIVNVAAAISRR